MESTQLEIISQAETQIKIEPVWKPEILEEHEEFHVENIWTSTQPEEGKYLNIEEKPDITKEYCSFQYTDMKSKLICNNSFKIEEEEIQIKDENGQCLENSENNSKTFEEGDKCQPFYTAFAYKCSVCEKAFAKNQYLRKHLLIHSGEKNFKCSICGKLFSRKGDLNKHLLIHSGKKNFKCNVCEKSFTQSSSLNTHLVIHTGTKKFKSNLNKHLLVHKQTCGFCKKSFFKKGDLKNHLLIHIGENNFKCNICEISFLEKGKLKIHKCK